MPRWLEPNPSPIESKKFCASCILGPLKFCASCNPGRHHAQAQSLRQAACLEKSSQGRSALLIEGARRVGKSTLAREFGRNEYASCLCIDFFEAPDEVRGYFEDYRTDFDTLFLYLSTYYGVELHRRDTLVIFDEVQVFPLARGLIKYLVADGRYDYIETGSLLSIKQNVKTSSSPQKKTP